jgi:hypothetical protein
MSDPLAQLRRKTRLVAEVRYPAVPSLFDKRGQIIERIHPEIEKRFPVWSVETGSIKWLDRPVPVPSVSEFVIGLRQTSVIVEDVTMHDFTDMVAKHMRLAYDALAPALKQTDRIGVRFLEILSHENDRDYESARRNVLERFHKIPFSLPFKYTDSAYTLVHEKGRFMVQPTTGEDEWCLQTFREPKQSRVGYALDIDSFHTSIKIKDRDGLVKAVQAVLDVSKGVEVALAKGLGLAHG